MVEHSFVGTQLLLFIILCGMSESKSGNNSGDIDASMVLKFIRMRYYKMVICDRIITRGTC